MGGDAIVIAGGGELYAQTIGRADRLAITEVALAPKGDAVFPRIDPTLWREIRREAGVRGPKDEADFSFVDYERAEQQDAGKRETGASRDDTGLSFYYAPTFP